MKPDATILATQDRLATWEEISACYIVYPRSRPGTLLYQGNALRDRFGSWAAPSGTLPRNSSSSHYLSEMQNSAVN